MFLTDCALVLRLGVMRSAGHVTADAVQGRHIGRIRVGRRRGRR